MHSKSQNLGPDRKVAVAVAVWKRLSQILDLSVSNNLKYPDLYADWGSGLAMNIKTTILYYHYLSRPPYFWSIPITLQMSTHSYCFTYMLTS